MNNEFIESCKKAKKGFITALQNIEFNNDLRMHAENMIIMYDQMVEFCEKMQWKTFETPPEANKRILIKWVDSNKKFR